MSTNKNNWMCILDIHSGCEFWTPCKGAFYFKNSWTDYKNSPDIRSKNWIYPIYALQKQHFATLRVEKHIFYYFFFIFRTKYPLPPIVFNNSPIFNCVLWMKKNWNWIEKTEKIQLIEENKLQFVHLFQENLIRPSKDMREKQRPFSILH